MFAIFLFAERHCSLLVQPASVQVSVFQVFQLQHSCHHYLKGSDTGDLKFLQMHEQLTRHNHRLSFYIFQLHIYCIPKLLLYHLDPLLVFHLFMGTICFYIRGDL